MARSVGIIAYGKIEDRQKVEALAKASGISVSAWIVDQIRSQFAELFEGTANA